MSGIPRIEKPRLKLILVGCSGVGKTCLIACFFRKPFDPAVMSTVSPAYMFQEVIRQDSLPVCLQIWDTAGQERYRSVSSLFYRDANVALVCYEAGNEESMETVTDWVAKVKKEVPDCEFLFVATKSDLLQPGQAEAVKAEAEKAFDEFQPKGCFVTSSVTRDGVDELFKAAAELFKPKQLVNRQMKPGQDIGAKTGPESGCC
jgi:small GTP-binding protein